MRPGLQFTSIATRCVNNEDVEGIARTHLSLYIKDIARRTHACFHGHLNILIAERPEAYRPIEQCYIDASYIA